MFICCHICLQGPLDQRRHAIAKNTDVHSLCASTLASERLRSTSKPASPHTRGTSTPPSARGIQALSPKSTAPTTSSSTSSTRCLVPRIIREIVAEHLITWRPLMTGVLGRLMDPVHRFTTHGTMSPDLRAMAGLMNLAHRFIARLVSPRRRATTTLVRPAFRATTIHSSRSATSNTFG